MCNGALMVCFNFLVPANHKQLFTADSCCTCADALKSTQPLYRLMLMCVNNQLSDLLRHLGMKNSDLYNRFQKPQEVKVIQKDWGI